MSIGSLAQLVPGICSRGKAIVHGLVAWTTSEVATIQLSRIQSQAEAGECEAQFRLGRMHETGQGMPLSQSKATQWYRRAAYQGNADGQFALGQTLLKWDGSTQATAEAGLWFQKAADQGHVEAQYKLGLMYLAGEGVPRDLVQGTRWLRKAAQKGHTLAEEQLRGLQGDSSAPENIVALPQSADELKAAA